jgi:hypothetical protein
MSLGKIAGEYQTLVLEGGGSGARMRVLTVRGNLPG